MPTFLKHILTGRDNVTYDIGRVLMFFGGFAYLACTFIAVLHSLEFDMEKFGYGLGALLGGGGVGLGAKAHTEPVGGGADAQ